MERSPLPLASSGKESWRDHNWSIRHNTAPLVNQMYNHTHDSRHYFWCVVFQWAAGVIPVLSYSGQNRHEAADTQYWLPEQRTTVLGTHDLPLWQVRNKAPCTLDLEIRCRWVFTFMVWLFHVQRRTVLNMVVDRKIPVFLPETSSL
jgi:hypothetical protein